MHVHHSFDMWADCCAGGRAKAEVGYEMAVHHINVDPIRALRFYSFDFSAEISEVSRKDGGCNFNRSIKGHGAAFLDDSLFAHS